jgi:hypothetical protein
MAMLADQVTRFEISAETGSVPGKIEFPFNPKTFSLDRKVKWDDAKVMRQAYGVLHFTGGDSDSLSFSTIFDNSEEEDCSVLDDVEKLYKLTKPQIKTEDGGQRPPIIKLTWDKFSFVGVIDGVKIDFTLFSEKGEPARAEVTVQMTGRAFSKKDDAKHFLSPTID